MDQRISTYSVKYKSRRWHVPVFCNLVDIAAYNAFILYQQCFPDWEKKKSHRRRLFLVELGVSLSEKYRDSRKSSVVSSVPSGPEKGRCIVCPRSRDRKTRSKCENCQAFVCEEHMKQVCVECSNCDMFDV
jgi:hypothetical protein